MSDIRGYMLNRKWGAELLYGERTSVMAWG